ncbi:unnamed protein product, partial [marine sediment metagenome]
SVCEVDHHPLWTNTLPEDGCMKDFIRQEIMNKNRQELPIFYRLNGAIYLAYYNYIKQCRSFIGKDTFAYIMPRERSVDIDNKMDFKLAEIIKVARRSLIATRDIRAREIIKESDITIKRPGTGIPPKFKEIVMGMKLINDIKQDEPFRWENFK